MTSLLEQKQLPVSTFIKAVGTNIAAGVTISRGIMPNTDLFFLPGTTNKTPDFGRDLSRLQGTTSGFIVVPQATASAIPEVTTSTEATRSALHELRKLSGLTWDQLASIFNVSRRSIHFWASGQPLSPIHEEKLNRLLGTLRYINRGNADINRSLLLKPGSDGKPLIDLLKVNEYEQVKDSLGPGNVSPKPKLTPLSEDARASLIPPNPADLVDALQEPVHIEVSGRGRTARTTRSRKPGRGQ